ncbi:RNA polymerase sigma factor [Pseudarthrobacter sp. So.54]
MSTDEELWRRAIEGDSLAFGEIFDRHHLRVLRHSFRVLGVKEDAEDVTAIVFLEAWRHGGDGVTSVSSTAH